MQQFVGASVGLAVWIGIAVGATTEIMALLDVGDYLLAALGVVLAVGVLAAIAAAALQLLLEG